MGRARFYSGAPAGPHLPPLGRSGRLLSIKAELRELYARLGMREDDAEEV